MSPSPCISVLLTSYNREDFIAEAIESVLAQSLTDFELIVCDDRSSDRTVAIAQAYAARDARIRISVNERNLGDYGNRRQVARLARGAFLKYHDSDDVMYRHCLSTMFDLLDAEPRAAFALSGPGGWPGAPCPMLLTPRLAYEREFLGSGLFQLGPASALFRTDAFHALGGFPEVTHTGDYLFWMHACAKVNVLLVPGDLFYYRLHSGQEITKPANVAAYARANGEAWRLLNSPECPLRGDTLLRAKRNFMFTRARELYHHVKGRRFGAAMTALRNCGLRPSEWASYLRLPQRRPDAGTPTPSDR